MCGSSKIFKVYFIRMHTEDSDVRFISITSAVVFGGKEVNNNLTSTLTVTKDFLLTSAS